MKSYFTILFAVVTQAMLAQVTLIPDQNFEQELINLGLDAGFPNGAVMTANIDTVTYLNVYQMNISSLTGIEDFADLEVLLCGRNNLTTLDVSQNTKLTELMCTNNQLTQLDVSNNSLLSNLNCGFNQLTSLDVSANLLLDTLSCFNNQLSAIDVSNNSNLVLLWCMFNPISSLDVSNNLVLEYLWCYDTQVSSVDVSNNPVLIETICSNNSLLTCLNLRNGNNVNMVIGALNTPNLTCIQVDDSVWTANTWAPVMPNKTFTENCNYSCTVGSDNNELNNQLSIYPNPTTGQINIELGIFSKSTLSIFNLVGELVVSKQITLPEFSIDIPGPPGLYLIQVETDAGMITRRVVKE